MQRKHNDDALAGELGAAGSFVGAQDDATPRVSRWFRIDLKHKDGEYRKTTCQMTQDHTLRFVDESGGHIRG